MKSLSNFARRLLGCPPAPSAAASDFYTVEMFEDIAGAWRWRIRHANGNVLATSEAYSSKAACYDTAWRLCTEARFDWKGTVS